MTSEKVVFILTIALHVRIGDIWIGVAFEIVRNLAVSILLGTLLIDELIEGLFPTERDILTINSPPILILAMHEERCLKTEDNQTKKIINVMAKLDHKQTLVHFISTLILKPLSKTSILVATIS